MTLASLLLAFFVLLLLGLVWFGLHYICAPRMDAPDAVARVTGNCGDTMEIALQFEGDQVKQVHSWTNGCSYSKLCVDAAAMLAKSKSISQLQTIKVSMILEIVGNLPETHLHCAQLAEITLERAVKSYSNPKSPTTSA